MIHHLMKVTPYRLSKLLISLLALAGLASSAFASVNLAPPSLDDPYYFGQLTYHKKLACGTCPLSKTTLDAENAKDFLQSLKTDQQFLTLLTNKERSAVAFYVKEFFSPR
ncbi:MAG: hypothetical protein COA46_07695 [Porticoccaceae bacterium]|nr:MAG: hypothetical protein COA46_07695 [Porticoccaceae bacterium]